MTARVCVLKCWRDGCADAFPSCVGHLCEKSMSSLLWLESLGGSYQSLLPASFPAALGHRVQM